MDRLRDKIKARNEMDWKEVYTKSTFKWYELATYGTSGETGEVVTGQESMRLLFRLEMGQLGSWRI